MANGTPSSFLLLSGDLRLLLLESESIRYGRKMVSDVCLIFELILNLLTGVLALETTLHWIL